MHTVELLDEAIAVAQQLGYLIRHEWMGGVGGACVIGDKQCLFVDLSLTTDEQLDLVIDSIKADHGVHTLKLSPAMAHLLNVRPATQYDQSPNERMSSSGAPVRAPARDAATREKVTDGAADKAA